jgi:hypothetical protein
MDNTPTPSTASDPSIDSTHYLARPTFSIAPSISQDGSLESAHLQPENVTMQRRAVPNLVYRSPELIKAGNRKMFITKWLFIGVLVTIK